MHPAIWAVDLVREGSRVVGYVWVMYDRPRRIYAIVDIHHDVVVGVIIVTVNIHIATVAKFLLLLLRWLLLRMLVLMVMLLM